VPLAMTRAKARLMGLAAYRCDIFNLGEAGAVPLWRRQSAVDGAGLDLLLQRCHSDAMRGTHADESNGGSNAAIGWLSSGTALRWWSRQITVACKPSLGTATYSPSSERKSFATSATRDGKPHPERDRRGH
jgi:hypothetical protein